jgi:hypothetical protein
MISITLTMVCEDSATELAQKMVLVWFADESQYCYYELKVGS